MFKFGKQNKGFSVTELVVGLGVSAIVAMGTSAVMTSMFEDAENSKRKADAAYLAEEIRTTLSNTKLRRTQATSTSASEKVGCGGIFDFTAADPSERAAIVSRLKYDTAGVEVKVTLPRGEDVVEVQAGDDANSVVNGLSQARVEKLTLGGATVIASDTASETLSAEMYVKLGHTGGALSGTGSGHVYIGRFILKVRKNDAQIQECNVPIAAPDASKLCPEVDGVVSSADNSKCLNAQVETDIADGTELCPLGTYGVNDGSGAIVCRIVSADDCKDSLQFAGKGYNGGKFYCKHMRDIGNPAVDVPPPGEYAPADDIPGIDAYSDDCKPLFRSYYNCEQNKARNGGTATCPAPPTSGCTVVSTNPSPVVAGYPDTAIAAGLYPNSCRCGATTLINLNDYCAFCTNEVSVGYGNGNNAGDKNNFLKVYQCRNRTGIGETGVHLVQVNAATWANNAGGNIRCNQGFYRSSAGGAPL